MNKTIGILGGMGPMATCDLMKKIIENTEASCDQEHIRLCVDSNTNIPDRTGAILHGGTDPLPEMIKSAKYLQDMGADALIMPCNTAHYFLEPLQACVNIPVLSMLRETAQHLRRQGVEKAAVLATDGTVQTGLYEKALQEEGITAIYPEVEEQALIMSLIYDCVKAGKRCTFTEKIEKLCRNLADRGAQALILGCTELPVAFSSISVSTPTVDPTEILAKAAIRFVGHKVK